jgi:hypothetical protein
MIGISCFTMNAQSRLAAAMDEIQQGPQQHYGTGGTLASLAPTSGTLR